MKEMMVKCRCGVEFDLAEAPWCDHPNPNTRQHTKMCPNGHCICYLLDIPGHWRPATEEEQKLGFGVMLREEHGGVKTR